MTAEVDALMPGLRTALAGHPQWADAELAPLPDKGLAHHHVSLAGTGILARIPKQSQLQLNAGANLAYQAACFDRAGRSGHTPLLHAVIRPGPLLPRGALLVDEVPGRAPVLPDDLEAIVTALAGIHSLPLPPVDDRPPLWDHDDPLAALASEIQAQARYLDDARVSAGARSIVDRELARLSATVERADRPQKRLISFDAHPGNFLIRPSGTAVLVDLEKCRYSYPALDLAHATLYTSTTWEEGIVAVLSTAEVDAAYATWSAAYEGEPDAAWQTPLRRAMWLWSATWCAKWRVLSASGPTASADGEDWSARRSADALTGHVRERVDHYLDETVIEQITREFDDR